MLNFFDIRYVTLKNPHNFFFNKIKYTWVIFCNSLRSHLSTFWQKEILSIFFCSYWNAQVFNCTLRHIWNGRFGLFPKNNIFFLEKFGFVTLLLLWAPNLMQKFRKIIQALFQKKLITEILTYWPTDQAIFKGHFQLKGAGRKIINCEIGGASL